MNETYKSIKPQLLLEIMKNLAPYSVVIRCAAILSSVAIVLYAPLLLSADQPRALEWEELVPEGWNPNSVFDQFTDEEFAAMSDEKYLILQKEAQAMLEAAPTVGALDGETVKIPGFMLPLEFDETNIKEFLLVPYFGACVHTPPPPANQIIHGKMQSDFAVSAMFEPVWISGRLKTLRSQQQLGESGVSQTLNVETGYTMEVEEVTPYKEAEE